MPFEKLDTSSHLGSIDNCDFRLPSFGLTILMCEMDRRAGKSRRDPIAHTKHPFLVGTDAGKTSRGVT